VVYIATTTTLFHFFSPAATDTGASTINLVIGVITGGAGAVIDIAGGRGAVDGRLALPLLKGRHRRRGMTMRVVKWRRGRERGFQTSCLIFVDVHHLFYLRMRKREIWAGPLGR